MLMLKAAPEYKLLPAYKHEPNVRCPNWLSVALSPGGLDEKLPAIIRRLRAHEFDAIACRGLSGMLVAPIVAQVMGKTLIVVRNTSNCHSCRTVEGDYAAKRYVILDDFVSSGMTCEKIISEIMDAMPEAECIGVCEYMMTTMTSDLALKNANYLVNRVRRERGLEDKTLDKPGTPLAGWTPYKWDFKYASSAWDMLKVVDAMTQAQTGVKSEGEDKTKPE